VAFGLVGQALEQLGGPDLLAAAARARPSADPSVPYYRALGWVRGREVPTGLVVDDLHWGDEDSLGLLGFLCRRVARLPVASFAGLDEAALRMTRAASVLEASFEPEVAAAVAALE
jgi:predicted ATPase